MKDLGRAKEEVLSELATREKILAEWHTTSFADKLKPKLRTVAEFRKQIEQEGREVSILLGLIIESQDIG